jgi:hypothetical protein
MVSSTVTHPTGLISAYCWVLQVCLATQNRFRGGGVPWKGGFWSDGTQEKVDGYLFNETPPPPGQSRRLESWEIP